MSQVTTQPSTTRIWEWLDAVPDPEIPVISLVDLGIIRDVAWEGGTLVVTVTPTYSGCPATSVIAMDIETALRDRGIEDLKLKTQISPAWTTDWLSEKGRTKLEDYGIAPPSASRRAGPLPALRVSTRADARSASSARPPARPTGGAMTA